MPKQKAPTHFETVPVKDVLRRSNSNEIAPKKPAPLPNLQRATQKDSPYSIHLVGKSQ